MFGKSPELQIDSCGIAVLTVIAAMALASIHDETFLGLITKSSLRMLQTRFFIKIGANSYCQAWEETAYDKQSVRVGLHK
jgi:hypothetical protein